MEIIKLNLIPSGVNPTCHAKQYDKGRTIRFELFNGLTPYTLQSGDTVTLNLRKPDNTIIEASVTATQGNKYVDLVTTEQTCAVAGYNLGTFKIVNGETDIGTLDFIMEVGKDVLANGIPSQSVIEDLDALVTEAVGDDFYNKNQIDAALALKANQSTTYTKSQVDNIVNGLLVSDTLSGNTVKIENGSSAETVNLSYSGEDTVYMSNDDCAVLYARDTDAVLPYKISKDDDVTFFIKDGTVLDNSVRVNFYDENHDFIDYWSIKTTRQLEYDNNTTAFFVQINMNCPNGVVVRKGTSESINPNYEVKTVESGTVNLYDGNTYFYTNGSNDITVTRVITPEDYTDKKCEELSTSVETVDEKATANEQSIGELESEIAELNDEIKEFYNYSVIPINLVDIDTTRPYLYGANENLVGKFKIVVDDDLFCRVVKQVNGSVVYYSDWAKETEYEFEYNTINQFVIAKGANYDQIVTESDKVKIHLYRVEENNTSKNRGILKPYGVHYIGHAGADLSAPSNSIASFKIAAQDSILWGIETDIRETSDGVLVCLHDSDISITTNGTGNINEMTYAESQQYTIDVGSHIADFPNEKIPTFKAYLTECRRNCKVPVIEVKADVPIDTDTLIGDLKECGLNENCIVQSFDYHTLLRCRVSGFKGVCFLIITGSVPKTASEMERIFAQIGWIGNCGLAAYIPVSSLDHSNYLHNLGELYGAWDTTIHDRNDVFGDLLCDVATISV